MVRSSASGTTEDSETDFSLAKPMMEKGIIGEVTSIEAEEGSTANSPRSPAYFDPVQAGGSTLIERRNPLD